MGLVLEGEVKRQAGRLLEQNTKFKNSSAKLFEELTAIAKEVKSEDSDLASTIELYANAYNELKDKLTAKYETLAGKMNTWVENTVKNQAEIRKHIEQGHVEVDHLNSLYSTLNK